MNFSRGETVPNLAVVPVGSDGKIALFNGSTGATGLLVDVAGYFLAGSPTVPGAFVSVAPARVLDTRSGGGPLAAMAVRSVQVAGAAGVPSSGVSAVVVNVTVVGAGASGYVSAYADGAPRPQVSNVNFSRGETVPNLAVVPVGSDGKIALFNGSTGATGLLVDVAGYFVGTPTQRTPLGLQGWGYGPFGAIGNGSFNQQNSPASVTGMTNVTAISGGGDAAYAVRSDGTVWAWGANGNGQLGNGGTAKSPTPVKVNSITGMTAVAGGYDTGYARKSDGTVWAWGDNSSGQVGNGSTNNALNPVKVSGLTGVTAIAANFFTAYALKSDGTVWAWGDGDAGELGNGTTDPSSVPVQVSGLSGVTAIAPGSMPGTR